MRPEKCFSICVRLLVVISFLAIVALAVKAAPTPANASSVAPAAPISSFAVADFDGDLRPDLASIRSGPNFSGTANYSIQLRLSALGPQSIQLIAPAGGLGMEARDVNGDHAIDLVLFTASFRRPVAVFLNDGHGKFLRAQPSAFPGALNSSGTTWRTNSSQETGAVGPAPQSRDEISAVANVSPHGSSSGKSLHIQDPQLTAASLVVSSDGRAPPLQIQSR